MSHIDDEKKELVKEVNQWEYSSSEYSFVIDVKAKKHLDPKLMEFKDIVLSMLNKSFSLRGDGVLRYQRRLCVPNIDDMRYSIIA